MPAAAEVHPAAIVSPEATLGPGTCVGPFAVIEGPVTLGPGCVVRARATLIGPMTLGAGNDVGIGAVLGERPQHTGYAGESTRVEVGDGNVFREGATVHRGTPVGGGVTRVGSGNFVMVNAHVGHDCRVGDGCTLVNGAVLGGHVELGDRAIVSGNSAVHQFVRMGRLSLLSGTSATSRDVPPFVIQQGHNTACGVNTVGMRRAGMPPGEIAAVRRAYAILYLSGLTLKYALARIEAELAHSPAAREMAEFIRASRWGVIGGKARPDSPPAAEAA